MKKLLALVMTVALICCCFAGCGAADDGKYVVGICQLVTHDALDAATKGFKDAVIAELGEENVEFIEVNAANNPDTCTTAVNDFVSKKVDLIMANATPALQAAYNATTEIPILGTSVTEYGVALEIENFHRRLRSYTRHRPRYRECRRQTPDRSNRGREQKDTAV